MNSTTQAERIAREFDFGPICVATATRHFIKQMRTGLQIDGPTQIPSYVTIVPTGFEQGDFLAIDLGGTNCRACLVQLHGDSTYTLVQSNAAIPRDLRVNKTYKPLFRLIVDMIKELLDSNPENAAKTLGFTFSFTCDQTSLTRGVLLQWDKGWDIPDAIGQDPCAMLQEAIDERGLKISVVALVNDSVGTLLARSYTGGPKNDTRMSAIFGTGTNAAYVEQTSRIKKLVERTDFKTPTPDEIMIVNTEWGGFDNGCEVLKPNVYDKELDAESEAPGQQIFEKRTSGLYLGELFRLVVVKMVEGQSLHLSAVADSSLFRRYAISSSLLSQLAVSDTKDCAAHISKTLGAEKVSEQDVQALQLIARAIARRAARIAAAAIAALILESRPTTKISKPQKKSGAAMSSFYTRLWRIFRTVLARVGLVWNTTSPPSFPQLEVSSPEDHEASSSEFTSTIDIGVDGSLFEFYPIFEKDIRAAIREVPEFGGEGEGRIQFGLTKDGPALGAALIAHSVAKQSI